MSDDLRHLSVHISAHVDGAEPLSLSVDEIIPPAYDERDVAALTVRTIEDAAFRLNRESFGRTATLAALVAAAARLKALEAIKDAMTPGDLRDQIEAIFDLTNDEVTARYGDDPDGP